MRLLAGGLERRPEDWALDDEGHSCLRTCSFQCLFQRTNRTEPARVKERAERDNGERGIRAVEDKDRVEARIFRIT